MRTAPKAGRGAHAPSGTRPRPAGADTRASRPPTACPPRPRARRSPARRGSVRSRAWWGSSRLRAGLAPASQQGSPECPAGDSASPAHPGAPRGIPRRPKQRARCATPRRSAYARAGRAALPGAATEGTAIHAISPRLVVRGGEAKCSVLKRTFRPRFLVTRARAVVMSLWKVGDQATSELTSRFYQGLAGGLGRGRRCARPSWRFARRAPARTIGRRSSKRATAGRLGLRVRAFATRSRRCPPVAATFRQRLVPRWPARAQ